MDFPPTISHACMKKKKKNCIIVFGHCVIQHSYTELLLIIIQASLSKDVASDWYVQRRCADMIALT